MKRYESIFDEMARDKIFYEETFKQKLNGRLNFNGRKDTVWIEEMTCVKNHPRKTYWLLNLRKKSDVAGKMCNRKHERTLRNNKDSVHIVKPRGEVQGTKELDFQGPSWITLLFHIVSYTK